MRRHSIVVPALLLTVLALSHSTAEAQCVSSNRVDGQPSFGGSIQLRNRNLSTSQMNLVRAGYDAWNDCVGGGFPDFYEFYNWDTGPIIDLIFVPGMNPANPQSCGYYDAARLEIVLFESGRIGTETVPCTRDNIFIDTITHELGHALGLKNAPTNDPACSQYIMGPLSRTGPQTYIDRRLNYEECRKVDETQYTLFEQLLDLCAAGDVNACYALAPCEYPDICNGSPVVVDLKGDGFAFTNVDEGVNFDIDGDRKKERSAWTEAGSDDSFLVLDRNGNGRIDDASELFGDATPLISGEIANNGFQALFEYDTRGGGNHNGFIDAGDPIFSKLWLWRDANHDGRSSRQELTPLATSGITAIQISYLVRGTHDENDNWLRYWSVAFLGNQNAEAVDVFFKYKELE